MGYTKRYRRRHGLSGLGDLTSTLATAANVASDPYFPEVVCQIQALQAINHGQTPAACAVTPPGTPDDFGLANALTGLRAYVYAQANPWAYAVAAMVVVGLPMWIGFELGKGRA